jgi:hypothetical protein
LDKFGDELKIGDIVVVDRDLYEIENITALDTGEYLLGLLEIGRLTSIINERRMNILSQYVELFEGQNYSDK